MSANITYSQLEREACKAAKLAKCAAQRAACLAALQEKRRGPPSELVEAMKIVEGCLREHASCASVCLPYPPSLPFFVSALFCVAVCRTTSSATRRQSGVLCSTSSTP